MSGGVCARIAPGGSVGCLGGEPQFIGPESPAGDAPVGSTPRAEMVCVSRLLAQRLHRRALSRVIEGAWLLDEQGHSLWQPHSPLAAAPGIRRVVAGLLRC